MPGLLDVQAVQVDAPVGCLDLVGDVLKLHGVALTAEGCLAGELEGLGKGNIHEFL